MLISEKFRFFWYQNCFSINYFLVQPYIYRTINEALLWIYTPSDNCSANYYSSLVTCPDLPTIPRIGRGSPRIPCILHIHSRMQNLPCTPSWAAAARGFPTSSSQNGCGIGHDESFLATIHLCVSCSCDRAVSWFRSGPTFRKGGVDLVSMLVSGTHYTGAPFHAKNKNS